MCELYDIIHGVSAPYYFQPNDIVKHTNRTLIETMSVVLLSSKLFDNMGKRSCAFYYLLYS